MQCPPYPICITLLALFVWPAAAGETLPKLVKKVEPAVVTLRSYDASGKLLVQGSGFLVNPSGRVVTSRHVVSGAARVDATTNDGTVLRASSIQAEDATADLAVLLLHQPGKHWRSLQVRRGMPDVGQTVLVVGSPLGFERSVSTGIVSAIRNVAGVGMVLQMTAPISPGSSGSPVVNLDGEVIGIVRSQREEGQNLNFAVPAERVLMLTPAPGPTALLR